MTTSPVDLTSVRRRKNRTAAGNRRELAEVGIWQERGYIASRTRPNSQLGDVCDVVAMKHIERADPTWRGAFGRPYAELIFAEVKSNRGNAFMNFRKPDREALKLAAKMAGATPLLVHWPPNGQRREISADEWPE